MQVIIETPKGSHQKFDYNPTRSTFELTKLLPCGMVFPFDFGFIPGTIGQDGDPLDVLVISELATFTGCSVGCRIIGTIKAMQREVDGRKVRNDRLIAIPEISITYSHIHTLSDLTADLLMEIEKFFVNYNDMAGKSFQVTGHQGPKAAMKTIEKSQLKADRKEKLVQVFLPFSSTTRQKKKISSLEKILIDQFGGVSVYAQSPVSGKWQDDNHTEKDQMIVFEIMVPFLEVDFWTSLKLKLQKDFRQKEILIRHLNIGTIAE